MIKLERERRAARILASAAVTTQQHVSITRNNAGIKRGAGAFDETRGE